ARAYACHGRLKRPDPRLFARTALGLHRFYAAGELLDAALSLVELGRADRVELLAALPERDRLVEARLAPLEPLADPLQLALRLLEGALAERVSPTVAPKPPAARSTSTCVPVASSELERTIASPLRTIA